MRRLWLWTALIAGAIVWVPAFAHEEESDLPAGPIRERHALMEDIGKNAKVIGEAMKTGDFGKIPAPATQIVEASKRIEALFPEDSTDPKSRAKPEIWIQPAAFKADINELESSAGALAAAADERNDVPQAANRLFGACKSCHDKFRKPEE